MLRYNVYPVLVNPEALLTLRTCQMFSRTLWFSISWPALDEVLHIWQQQHEDAGIPMTWPLINNKIVKYGKNHPGTKPPFAPFLEGWLFRLKSVIRTDVIAPTANLHLSRPRCTMRGKLFRQFAINISQMTSTIWLTQRKNVNHPRMVAFRFMSR